MLPHCSGPVFCLSLGVSSGCAQPITGQVTSVTWPVIGSAQSELTLSKRQKTGPGHSEQLSLQYGSFSWVAQPVLICAKKSGPSLKHTGHSDIHSRSRIKQTTKRNVVSKYSILSIKRLCCTFQFNLSDYSTMACEQKSAILRALYCSDNVVRQCLAKTKVYKNKIPCIVKHYHWWTFDRCLIKIEQIMNTDMKTNPQNLFIG